MKKINSANNDFKGYAIAGSMLVIPTTYFLTAVFLKYGLGAGFLFDPFDSFFSNKIIDIFIFLSPFTALLINSIPLLNLRAKTEDGSLKFNVEIKINRINFAVSVLSFCYIAVMSAYAITENLGHYYRGQM